MGYHFYLESPFYLVAEDVVWLIFVYWITFFFFFNSFWVYSQTLWGLCFSPVPHGEDYLIPVLSFFLGESCPAGSVMVGVHLPDPVVLTAP